MTAEIYAVLADLWCNPQDVNDVDLARASASVLAALQALDPECATLLNRFLHERSTTEDYIDLFELNPKCSLYLGSHVFDEPKTCAQAGVCDRNRYMLDLLGIYRHFKLVPNGREMPDYLPLIIELIALTAGSADALRGELIQKHVLPYLPPLRAKLGELRTAYQYLLDVLERLLKLDSEKYLTVVDHA